MPLLWKSIAYAIRVFLLQFQKSVRFWSILMKKSCKELNTPRNFFLLKEYTFRNIRKLPTESQSSISLLSCHYKVLVVTFICISLFFSFVKIKKMSYREKKWISFPTIKLYNQVEAFCTMSRGVFKSLRSSMQMF